MKFSKLPKEKRNQLVLVVVGTLAVLGALGFGLIKFQFDNLKSYAARQASAELQLKRMEDAVKRKELVESVLAEATQALSEKEAGMASGDLYSWLYGTVRRFQKNYKVELPQLSPISAQAPVNLIPNCPYKQASMQVGGTAYYHELGQFLADFENAFPLIRVVNLTVELNHSPAPGEAAKVAFKMELVTLVKANQP